ncbi:MAG: Flp family type IVb pilin [Beijerinckiaceae bacterium]
MKKLTARFIKDQSGSTAIEYCLIAGLIAIVIVGAVTRAGTNLSSKYNTIANDVT